MADENPDVPSPDRNPLSKVAVTVGGISAVVISLLGSAVGFGMISGDQAAAITVAAQHLPEVVLYVGVGVTLVTGLVSGVVSAFATAHIGKNSTTPLVSPRDNDGTPLVPAVVPTTLVTGSPRSFADGQD